MNKQRQLARAESSDDVDAVVNPPTADYSDLLCPSMANDDNIADEHYAVSEAVIENAREQHSGNWLNDASQEFTSAHGQIVEGTDVDDPNDEYERECQSFLTPGLCRKDFEQLPDRFYELSQQFKNVLRHFRDMRRSRGYVPDHALILWCDPLRAESIQDVILLTRMSFSPFDATAVQMQMTGPSTASIVLSEFPGPEFIPLPRVLLKMASTTLEMRVAKYKAISLGQVCISLSELQTADALSQQDKHRESDSEDSSSDEDVDTRTAILKAALHMKPKSKPAQAKNKSKPIPGSSTQKQQQQQSCILDMRKKKQQTQQPRQKKKQLDSADKGIASTIDGFIDTEWAAAKESQVGPLPLSQQSNGRNSGSRCNLAASSATNAAAPSNSSSSKAPVPIPIQSFTHPWRDEKGYCWVYDPDKSLPLPLGLAPSHQFCLVAECRFVNQLLLCRIVALLCLSLN